MHENHILKSKKGLRILLIVCFTKTLKKQKVFDKIKQKSIFLIKCLDGVC